MVKRKEGGELPQKFDGYVEKVVVEKGEGTFDNGDKKPDQYHVIIMPTTPEVVEFVKDSPTQRMHAYVKISDKSTQEMIAEGSILDAYVTEIETVLPQTKDLDTHITVFQYLVGKEFSWVRKKIGKAYEGKPAKELYVPHAFIADRIGTKE